MQNYFEQITGLNVYRTYTLTKSCKAAEAFYALQAYEIPSFLQQFQPQKLTHQLFITSQTNRPEKSWWQRVYSRLTR